MRHGDGDDAKTFVISDEFARFVIEPAEKNSGCVKQGDNDDKDLENKKMMVMMIMMMKMGS